MQDGRQETEVYSVGHVETLVHGRFLIRRVPVMPAPLLVGFHGYAENAADQMERLRRIPQAEHWLICSIQALHPFYTRSNGEVVASWMTSLDRERAIEHNLEYVRRVLQRLARHFEGMGMPPLFAGFSQGAALAWRAACRLGSRGVIAVGAEIPPELTLEQLAAVPAAFLARGTNDRKYPPERMASDLSRLERCGVEVQTAEFPGGHLWNEALDPHLARFIERLPCCSGTRPVAQTKP
jgi:predicted esterase